MLIILVKFATISALVSALVAVGLIISARPAVLSGRGGLDFSAVRGGVETPAIAQVEITIRDGTSIKARHLVEPSGNAPLIILVHGSGWHGAQFGGLATALSEKAEILIPDLRGHGANPVRRGDVDYIGQLEDDIADIINARAKEGQEIILVGHSSGGGLVVRFAGGEHGHLIDKAVLLAPFLKYNAPTTRGNSGGWAQVLTRRIVGLTMLNAVGIRILNHLTVIQFNMPQAVLDGPLGSTATTAYSYRMNTSFAPRSDYLNDVAHLPTFLLIAGKDDEAFFADKYQPLMEAHTNRGQYRLLDGVSHLAVVDAPETATLIKSFLHGK